MKIEALTNNSENRESNAPEIEGTRVLLELLVQALVDDPLGVRVAVIRGAQSIVYEVSVTRDDVRRVIGRKGRTASAIRELMLNLGSKAGRRFLLEIVEPEFRIEEIPTLEG